MCGYPCTRTVGSRVGIHASDGFGRPQLRGLTCVPAMGSPPLKGMSGEHPPLRPPSQKGTSDPLPRPSDYYPGGKRNDRPIGPFPFPFPFRGCGCLGLRARESRRITTGRARQRRESLDESQQGAPKNENGNGNGNGNGPMQRSFVFTGYPPGKMMILIQFLKTWPCCPLNRYGRCRAVTVCLYT